jgi:predicted Zn-dependent protease
MLRALRTFFILTLVLVLGACAVSPTGRQQLLVMPSAQLDAMGASAFQDLKRSKPRAPSPRDRAYVRCVANAITAGLRSGPARWEVEVFQDDSPNAFALPGGKIGVHTGLLQVADNQDQLAAVIGHEVGHVLSQHANERMSQEILVQGGLAAANSVAGGASGLSPQVMQALGLGAQVGILLPFSRAHESEADVIGLDLMARAGFDPRQSVNLWQNMARAGAARPVEFLSTHPAHNTRIQGLQARMGAAMAVYENARAQGKRPACER